MKRMGKIARFFLIISIILSLSPLPTFAAENSDDSLVTEQTMVVNSSDEVGKAILYENDNKDSKQLIQIENGIKVVVLEKGGNFTKVQYEIPEKNQIWVGYIENAELISPEETTDSSVVDSTAANESNEESTTTQNIEATSQKDESDSSPIIDSKTASESTQQSIKSESQEKSVNTEIAEPRTMSATVDVELEGITVKKSTNVYSTTSTSSTILKSYDNGTILKLYEQSSDWYVISINVDGTGQTGYIQKSDIDLVTSTPVLYEGIALKVPTNLYDSPTRDAKVIKTYSKGSFLRYYSFTSEWYKTEVKVDGVYHTVYLNKEDVEQETANPELYEGIATKESTNMYAFPMSNSKVVKVYNEGSLLKYYSYTSGWYKSKVSVDGVYQTIYINKDDVDPITTNPVLQEGFALNNEMKIYDLPSRDSEVLRTFDQGTYLLFYTYTSNWYKSQVRVDGRMRTIYINKDDVEKPTTQPELHKGLSLKDPTNMYASPSRDSKVIRTFALGSTLLYYTYSSQWYKSYVTYNGSPHVIYINNDDVEQITDNPILKEGFALNRSTEMYASPSLSSKVLRTFEQGFIMKFYTYSPNWYKSNTTVDGKSQTIFIHKDDVELVNQSSEILQGLALKTTTEVYSLPSRDSSVLKFYSKFSLLKYYNFSENWYKSYVNVNGKLTACYIKKTDVGAQKSSFYNLNIEQAVTLQMNTAPLTDSSTDWLPATSKQVEYYLNPFNFQTNSDEYLQFLILSNPAGTNATEINNRVLFGQGVLAGKGSSFINAANTYHINEIYLISHSLLETGHGTSPLATGIKVNDVTVYNVYGVGAYDQNPEYYGAKFAYDHGWTSVEKAIVGGAQFVSTNYIHAGQDTLYKMRWNPEAMNEYGYASHQYATDIGWAAKQTQNMARMLSSLTQYTLLYDIPIYQ